MQIEEMKEKAGAGEQSPYLLFVLKVYGKTQPHRKPVATAPAYKAPKKAKFSFWGRFTLNSTASPSPAPVHSPATADPKDKAPLKYSSVSRTEAAQLGMNPRSPVSRGWNALPERSSRARASSPA